MSKRLELKFLNEENKVVTINLDSPVEPANAEVIKQAMNEMILQDALTSSGGSLVSIHSARIVERNVEEIDLTV